MIVLHTQDDTIIREDADVAKGDFVSIYGENIGA